MGSLDHIRNLLLECVARAAGQDASNQMASRLFRMGEAQVMATYAATHSSDGLPLPDELFITSTQTGHASAFFGEVRDVFAEFADEWLTQFGVVRGISWQNELEGARALLLAWLIEDIMVRHSQVLMQAYQAAYLATHMHGDGHTALGEWRDMARKEAVEVLKGCPMPR